MFKILILFSFLLLFLVPVGAFAQETYVIKIPSGSADPNAPYFWSNQKDGSTTGDIEIVPGDSVRWSNADSASHTVTSGTPEEGPDGIFDSGLFSPGKSFTHNFDELGQYPYFCLVHPWMQGTVFVVKGFQVIPDVGSSVGDGSKVFDVGYKFNRVVSVSSIDTDQKSIMFELAGNAKSDDHTLRLDIPHGLLGGPYVVWVDGQKINEFDVVSNDETSSLTIPLTEKSKVLTIIGTSVVPEFGTIAILIFGSSIASVMLIRFKTRLLS